MQQVNQTHTAVEARHGYCHCGCGQETPAAKTSDREGGRTKGQPLRYLPGHHRRKPNRYMQVSTGFGSPWWIWQLAVAANGYGLARRAGGRMTQAHRLAYEE